MHLVEGARVLTGVDPLEIGVAGVSSNTGNSIGFTDQAFRKTSGPITCPGAGFFTATYAPVVDTSVEGGPVVCTN